jgi:hypothetical protein
LLHSSLGRKKNKLHNTGIFTRKVFKFQAQEKARQHKPGPQQERIDGITRQSLYGPQELKGSLLSVVMLMLFQNKCFSPQKGRGNLTFIGSDGIALNDL